MTYFKYCEFYRLLEKIVLNESGMYHCHVDTIALLKQILYSEYEYQKDDIEHILYHLRSLNEKRAVCLLLFHLT